MVLRSLVPCYREPWQFVVAVDEGSEGVADEVLAEACEDWAESRSQSCFAETTAVALWQPTPGCLHRREAQLVTQVDQSLGSVAAARNAEDAGEVGRWVHTGMNVHRGRRRGRSQCKEILRRLRLD